MTAAALLALAALLGTPQEGGGDAARTSVPFVDTTGLRPHVLDRLVAARQAVLDDPERARAWGDYGELLFAHQFFDVAERALAEAQRLAPESFRPVYVQAHAAEKNARPPEHLVALFRRALELRPDYVAAWRGLGTVLQREGRFDEARPCFERALELAPEFSGARLGLGQVLLSTGDVDGALENLEQVDRASPNDRAVLSALAQAYMRAGREAQARETARLSVTKGYTVPTNDPVLDEVSELGSSTFDARVRAEKALAEGRWEDAERDLLLFLEGRSGSIGIRYHLARARLGLGKLKEAKDDLKFVVDADPDHLDARLLYARLLMVGGRKLGAARKHVDYVLEREPTNVEALLIAATIDVHAEEYEAAVELFEQATALQGAVHAGVQAHRMTDGDRLMHGVALLGTERYADAARLLEQLVAGRPALAEAHFRLASAYEGLGRIDDAIASYEEAGRRDRSLPVEEPLRRLRARRRE